MISSSIVNRTCHPIGTRNVSVCAKRTTKDVSKQIRDGAAVATASVAVASPALADTVDDGINSVIGVLKDSGDIVRQGLNILGEVVSAINKAVDTVAPVVKEGYEVAAPTLSKAYSTTTKTLGPLIDEQVNPLLRKGVAAVESQIQENGINIQAIKGSVKTLGGEAVNTLSPTVSTAVDKATTLDTLQLAELGVAGIALFYFAPALGGFFAGSLRGYGGDVRAAAALDEVANDGAAVVVDIRSQLEKEQGGIPDLPGGASGRLIDLEFCTTDNRRLRGQLRNAEDVEIKMTSLQIGALKRLSKSTPIYLLDKNGGVSKRVAKELGRQGFGRVYVVEGGFSGRNGWVSSKLQVKPSATVRFAEVVPGRFGTILNKSKRLPG